MEYVHPLQNQKCPRLPSKHHSRALAEEGLVLQLIRYQSLDYRVWSRGETEGDEQPDATLDSVKAKVKRIFISMDREMLTKACSRFSACVEAAICLLLRETFSAKNVKNYHNPYSVRIIIIIVPVVTSVSCRQEVHTGITSNTLYSL